jgi:Domain of unknown function (DUF3523)
MEEERKKLVDAINAAFGNVGSGVTALLTDTTRLMTAIGGLTLLALGVYSTRESVRVAGKSLDRWFGTPRLVGGHCPSAPVCLSVCLPALAAWLPRGPSGAARPPGLQASEPEDCAASRGISEASVSETAGTEKMATMLLGREIAVCRRGRGY